MECASFVLKKSFSKMQINKIIHLKYCTADFPSRFLVKSRLWQFAGQRLSHTKRLPHQDSQLPFSICLDRQEGEGRREGQGSRGGGKVVEEVEAERT